jgi:hypothetical protein
MLFHTPEDRAEFFTIARQNPRYVHPGSAMDHARSTHLGLWGNSDALARDCATVMVFEVFNVLTRDARFHDGFEQQTEKRFQELSDRKLLKLFDNAGVGNPYDLKEKGEKAMRPLIEAILYTDAFQRAFDEARYPREAQMNNAVRDLCRSNNPNWDELPEKSLYKHTSIPPERVAEAVLDDLRIHVVRMLPKDDDDDHEYGGFRR